MQILWQFWLKQYDGSIIGPIPLNIMEAFKRLSYQSNSGIVNLYPNTPINKQTNIMKMPKNAFFHSLL